MPSGAGPASRRHLLFLDEHGLGRRLADRLVEVGAEAVTVSPGAGFARRDDGAYVVHPGRRADYDALIAGLRERDQLPEEIVHLGCYGGTVKGETPFYSLLFLAQAWAAGAASRPVRITAVASGLHAVSDGDAIEPLKALLLGPCRVIPQELAGVACRSVDLEPPGIGDAEALAGCLLRELGPAGELPSDTAWRRGRRWVEDLEPVRLAEPSGRPAALRQGAVVLLTGGLGGIGLALAEHLFERVRARLVLVGRSAFPGRSEWDFWLRSHPPDDPVSRRLRRLLALEERGAEILALSADVTVRQAMEEVRRRAEERFGAVHGIIHAAGVPGGGVLEWKRPEEAARVLAPKVAGTLALDAAFHGVPLDFLVLCSSQASRLGGLGQVDYCAANAFLDAFAQARSARGEHAIAVAWDAWREAGMAVETAAPSSLQAVRQASLETALSSAEGADALLRILDQRSPQVVVSTHDFLDHLRASRRAAPPRTAPTPAVEPAFRPDPEKTVDAPVEREIAAIWQELLGLPGVGRTESFFDLGGDSLIALGVAARLRERYGVDLPLARLLESPTVAALARVVEAALAPAPSHRRNGLPPTVIPLVPQDGPARPFFVVHPLGGNVLCYQALARHLGPRPVYGLQAPGLDGPEGPCANLEELAAWHLDAVRRVQPSGPYLLAGFSMGGAVAYEMARQLVLGGETVGLLALMDTYAPNDGEALDDLRLLAWKAATLRVDVNTEELARRAGPEERLAYFVETLTSGDRTTTGLDPARLRRLLQVELANLGAFLRYHPSPLGGPMVYFRCTETQASPEDELPLDRAGCVAVWRELTAAPLTVYEIPAPHDALLDDPWVGIVGQYLRSHLDELDEMTAEPLAV
jgi:thioesterase domain-containing protein/NAD(P)-dependent dehydrogenase (short-subunit alcohol dehydrogenase family)/acyl carrier protein